LNIQNYLFKNLILLKKDTNKHTINNELYRRI
jgi:hypothetical protein